MTTAREKVVAHTKRAIRRLTPQYIARTQATKRTIDHFAEKVGLVYFGVIDQRDEDYRLVRGHTVSATHLDNHFCIGTYQGYDTMLVLRDDVVRLRSGREQHCHWLIFAFDLHSKVDAPSLYVGHRTRDHIFAAKYDRRQPLSIGHLAPYPEQFLAHYTVYGRAGQSLDIERLFTPDVALGVATHFQNASFEVEDTTLYLYADSEHPREAFLEKLLASGVWLAEQLDAHLALEAQAVASGEV